MLLEEYFKNAKVILWPEKYVIVKAKQQDPQAFVNVNDQHEITVIIEERKVDTVNVIESVANWRILTLDIVFPMDVVGVTAKIATALAAEKISIMPIAAYSRDHFLIRDQDLEKALAVFKSVDIKVIHS